MPWEELGSGKGRPACPSGGQRAAGRVFAMGYLPAPCFVSGETPVGCPLTVPSPRLRFGCPVLPSDDMAPSDPWGRVLLFHCESRTFQANGFQLRLHRKLAFELL